MVIIEFLFVFIHIIPAFCPFSEYKVSNNNRWSCCVYFNVYSNLENYFFTFKIYIYINIINIELVSCQCFPSHQLETIDSNNIILLYIPCYSW